MLDEVIDINIDGERLNQFHFADDIVLIRQFTRYSRDALRTLQQVTQKVSLKNYRPTKTKITNFVPNEEVIIKDTAIEIVREIQIEKYIYLDHEMRISKE